MESIIQSNEPVVLDFLKTERSSRDLRMFAEKYSIPELPKVLSNLIYQDKIEVDISQNSKWKAL